MDNFCWTSACQTAFDAIKQKLLTAPVLAFPDFSKTFNLQCDASASGLGCVLSQHDSAKRDHASKMLNKHQKNYSIIELELLAIIFIFIFEYFHPYLYGCKFVIQMDHAPLKYLQNMKNPTGHFARWIAYLQQYTFEIEYHSGKARIQKILITRIRQHLLKNLLAPAYR